MQLRSPAPRHFFAAIESALQHFCFVWLRKNVTSSVNALFHNYKIPFERNELIISEDSSSLLKSDEGWFSSHVLECRTPNFKGITWTSLHFIPHTNSNLCDYFFLLPRVTPADYEFQSGKSKRNEKGLSAKKKNIF